MKEKTVLIASLITASMTIMMFAGAVKAWEYYNTGSPDIFGNTAPRDNLAELFGPRLDRIQIDLFAGVGPEFTALSAGQIDMTDWPVDQAHYTAWTSAPLNNSIAVSYTGPDFSMYIIDMRLDNRTLLDDGTTNWAYYYHTSPGGADIPEPLGYNPMSDVWLRRAIATTVDKAAFMTTVVTGPPFLAFPMYTPLSAAYRGYVHPQITPTGIFANYTYLTPTGFGSANVAWGNAMLDAHGYVYNAILGRRQYLGMDFYIDFYYRTGDPYRSNLATVVMAPLLTAAPPAGLGLAVNMLAVTSSGARNYVMSSKKGHLYTGGWGLTQDPDHLWYLFGNPFYWHPGRPPNYMYYPGDGNQYTVPTNGWTLTDAQLTAWGYPSGLGSGAGVGPDLYFGDPAKMWNAGDKVWMNPGNYWAWEMMTATTQVRAVQAAYKAQEWFAFWVCGDPVYTNNGYAAFYRTYVGNDNGNAYYGQPWKGVVNEKAFGVWTTASLYNMHPANANWGTGSATNITMRWGFREAVYSFNPIYADWVWDWYVMSNCYDSMIRVHPYTLADVGNLALNWQLSTWDASSLGLGTCSKVTFYMRHDLYWSDGMPLTSSDVYFTWGGPAVVGSISNLLAAKGLPPAYWSTNLADILSIFTPDPWTVVVYLDVQSRFALHSMSGWNIILPQHVWQPIILAGTGATNPFNMPGVCSGGWTMASTADPGAGGTITLLKNPLHNMQSGGKPMPLTINTVQTSNATSFPPGNPGEIGNTHWIWPGASSAQKAITVSVSVTIDSSYYYETGPNQADIYTFTKLTGLKNVTLWRWTGVGSPGDATQYADITRVNSGTAVNTTATTFVFGHYLGGTPMGVLARFNTTEITGWTWTADSTQISITVTALNLSKIEGNMTCNWKASLLPLNKPWSAGRAITTPLPDVEIFDLSTISASALTASYYFVKVDALINGGNVSTDGGLTWTTTFASPFDGMVKTYTEWCIVTSRFDIAGGIWKPIVTPIYQKVADLRVNLVDVFTCALAYGSVPGMSNWNPAADVNGDNRINLQDYFLEALNFGWQA